MENEIKIFRMRTLKSQTMPKQFIVVHFDGKMCHALYRQYAGGEWKREDRIEGPSVNLADIAALVRTSEECWVICEGLYPWLCHQGLYEQLVDRTVLLPTGNTLKTTGKLSGMFACGNPTIIDIRIAGKKLHCIDFANWGIEDVADLDAGYASLINYVTMVERYNMGSLQSTAGGQGKARFRTHDLGEQQLYCYQVSEVRQLERDAFYGGRCEPLTLGTVTEPCWHDDYSSLHATLALTKSFPTKLLHFGDSPPRCVIRKLVDDGLHIIAKLRLKTLTPDYPLRHNFGSESLDWRTVYPIGEFVTTLCHPELVHALDRDRIEQVYFFAAYRAEPIFAANSEWFFRTKQALAGDGLASMAGPLKLIQNSLYGAIGRRGRMWIDQRKWHDSDWGMWWQRHPVHGNVVVGRAIYGKHQYLDAGLEPENSCPAISATMFSYSRMALLRAIEIAGRENVHYYDTDGLVVNGEGHARLSDHFLDMRSKWQSCDMDFRGLKFYRHDETWVHAGVPAWAERHLDGSVSFEKHAPFNWSLWQNTPFAAKYLMSKMEPQPPYRHGVLVPNFQHDSPGCRTGPFEFGFNGFNNFLT